MAKRVDLKDVYYIEWIDANSRSDWNNGSLDLSIIKEIGWIIKEDKSKIIICSQLDTDKDNEDRFGNMSAIPKQLIIKRILIK